MSSISWWCPPPLGWTVVGTERSLKAQQNNVPSLLLAFRRGVPSVRNSLPFCPLSPSSLVLAHPRYPYHACSTVLRCTLSPVCSHSSLGAGDSHPNIGNSLSTCFPPPPPSVVNLFLVRHSECDESIPK